MKKLLLSLFMAITFVSINEAIMIALVAEEVFDDLCNKETKNETSITIIERQPHRTGQHYIYLLKGNGFYYQMHIQKKKVFSNPLIDVVECLCLTADKQSSILNVY